MTVNVRRDGNQPHHVKTVNGWIQRRRPAFTEAELAEALEEQLRPAGIVGLTSAEQEVWETHSGMPASSQQVARASASNAASRILMDSSALTAAEVAAMLKVAPSTVRHYRGDLKLFSYLANGRVLFPEWQFFKSRPLPHLDQALRAMPPNLHPQTVAGFFLSPQPELVLEDRPVTVVQWLVSGGSPEPVVHLASGLGTIL